jgi:hypothetical protein
MKQKQIMYSNRLKEHNINTVLENSILYDTTEFYKINFGIQFIDKKQSQIDYANKKNELITNIPCKFLL